MPTADRQPDTLIPEELKERLRERGIDPNSLDFRALMHTFMPPDLMPPPNPSPPAKVDRFGRRDGVPLPEKVAVALKIIENIDIIVDSLGQGLADVAEKVLKDFLESETGS